MELQANIQPAELSQAIGLWTFAVKGLVMNPFIPVQFMGDGSVMIHLTTPVLTGVASCHGILSGTLSLE